MPSIEGKEIREVWDFRLSSASPLIIREGTWKVQIWDKNNPDYDPENPQTLSAPLEEHDTGIAVERNDYHDTDKVKICYEWLLTVRDKYALPNIDELKPLVAKINEANTKLAELTEAS